MEQNREKNEITLKQLDAQLHQVNTDYTANSAGAAPRNDTEMNSLAGEGKTFDPVVQLATAFNRDIGDPSKVTREAAMGSLAKQGFDANTILGMTDAWKAAVQHSRNTSPEEIAPAIQAFVTGQPFVWNAETKDANGRPMPLHGATRFDVSVVDNTGNNISFRIPQDKLANLRNWRLQYTRQAQDTLSKNVGPQGPGVLSQLPGVPGVRGQTPRLDYEQPGVGTRPDWTATEQTPFYATLRVSMADDEPLLPAHFSSFDQSPRPASYSSLDEDAMRRPQDATQGTGLSGIPAQPASWADVGHSAMAGVHAGAATGAGFLASIQGNQEGEDFFHKAAERQQQEAAESRAAMTPTVEGGVAAAVQVLAWWSPAPDGVGGGASPQPRRNGGARRYWHCGSGASGRSHRVRLDQGGADAAATCTIASGIKGSSPHQGN